MRLTPMQHYTLRKTAATHKDGIRWMSKDLLPVNLRTLVSLEAKGLIMLSRHDSRRYGGASWRLTQAGLAEINETEVPQ